MGWYGNLVARLKAALCLAAVVLLTGCASGLDKSATSVDFSEKSIVILTVRFTNAYRPQFTASALGMSFRRLDVPDIRQPKSSSPNSGKPEYAFYEYLNSKSDEALLVVRLPPGRHEVSRLLGTASFALIQGSIDTEVEAPFELKPQTAMYLGHVHLVNVERTNSTDQATGFAVPLISQAAAGISGGKLDVRLIDRYEADISKAKAEYPALRTLEIARTPLAAMRILPAGGATATARSAEVVR